MDLVPQDRHIVIPLFSPLPKETKGLSFLARYTPGIQATCRHIQAWEKIIADKEKKKEWYLIYETYPHWKLNFSKINEKIKSEIQKCMKEAELILLSATSSVVNGPSGLEELQSYMETDNKTAKLKKLKQPIRGLACYLVRNEKVAATLLENAKTNKIDMEKEPFQIMLGLPIHEIQTWIYGDVWNYPDFLSTNYQGFYRTWGCVGLEAQKIPHCCEELTGFFNTTNKKWSQHLEEMKKQEMWKEAKALLKWMMKTTHDVTEEECNFNIWDQWSIVAWNVDEMEAGIEAAHELLRRNRFSVIGRQRLLTHKKRLLENMKWFHDESLNQTYQSVLESLDQPF